MGWLIAIAGIVVAVIIGYEFNYHNSNEYKQNKCIESQAVISEESGVRESMQAIDSRCASWYPTK